MGRYLACLLLTIAAAVPCTAAARSTHPDNKVVAFKHSGAWEIWCIEQGDTKAVICDLNLVIFYQPHPDFRAMIPRVYAKQAGRYLIELEYEAQTSFSSGYLQSDSNQSYDLSACDRPCLIEGDKAEEWIAFLRDNGRVTIHFTDYFIQDFSINVDLTGFAMGLDLLRRMQSEYSP